jgi:DNA-binding GntR family transcriptional regulator
MNIMALRKLEPSALVGDQAFGAIQDAIMSGEYGAGHRLRIRDIAATLGTSVMPVREAIRRLEENGLVETVPYKGAVVKGFTLEELERVYNVRRLLEVEATRLGARAADAAVLERIQREFDLMRLAVLDGRTAEYLDRDEALLAELYSASGNPVLLEMIAGLWKRCRSYKLVGAQKAIDEGASTLLWEYQERILAALAAGDIDVAVKATEDSLDRAIERIEAGMQQMEHS